MKPEGTSFWQALSTRLSVIGTFKLTPRTLALIAVQRQSAASKSAKPWSNEQHLLEEGDPTTILTSPKTSAQTPSFNVSLGHFDFPEGEVGGLGLGLGLGLGEGVGVGLHVPHAWENVE